MTGEAAPRRASVRSASITLLVLALSALVFMGWIGDPVLLGLSVALQLPLGGFGGIALIGPAREDHAIGPYLTLPVASVALTLGGRLVAPTGVGLLLIVVVAAALWIMVQTEIAYAHGDRPKTILDLVLVAVLFAGTAGTATLASLAPWLPSLVVVGLLALVLGVRAAEARGALGGGALGQAVLHALAVVQLSAGIGLLELPGAIGPAVLALGFYAWSGAADALQGGASRRSVLLEFGALAALGLVVALLVYRG